MCEETLQLSAAAVAETRIWRTYCGQRVDTRTGRNTRTGAEDNKPSGVNNNNNINIYHTSATGVVTYRYRVWTILYCVPARRWTACANGHVATDYNIYTTATTRHRNGRSPPDRLHARAGSAREDAIVAVRGLVGTRWCAGAAVFQHARPPTRRREKRRCTATTDVLYTQYVPITYREICTSVHDVIVVVVIVVIIILIYYYKRPADDAAATECSYYML